MILNTIIFSILSVLIVFSTLGYGLIFANKILQNSQYLNLSVKGIFGIFFLYIISIYKFFCIRVVTRVMFMLNNASL